MDNLINLILICFLIQKICHFNITFTKIKIQNLLNLLYFKVNVSINLQLLIKFIIIIN